MQVAVAAGLEALCDAGIVYPPQPHPGELTPLAKGTAHWELPKSMQDTTGVVYATSFPALDAAIAEVSKFFRTKAVRSDDVGVILSSLRERLLSHLPDTDTDTNTDTANNNNHNNNNEDDSSSGSSETRKKEKKEKKLSEETEAALESIRAYAEEVAGGSTTNTNTNTNDEGKGKGDDEMGSSSYEFDRKFLFRVLVLGNAQLAQIIKAKGPNMQTNAACAGSTQAVALAFDMIQVGRAERMIVIAGDNAASDTLMPWLGNGFRALGAATICSDVKMASIPFDKRRRGMILGAGGIGMVLESEDGARRRYETYKNDVYGKSSNSANSNENTINTASLLIPPRLSPFRCRLLGMWMKYGL